MRTDPDQIKALFDKRTFESTAAAYTKGYRLGKAFRGEKVTSAPVPKLANTGKFKAFEKGYLEGISD